MIGWGQIVYGAVLSAVAAAVLIALPRGRSRAVVATGALAAADPDTVRDVIHAFNDRGLECLDPKWAGGRPRRITTDDET